MLILAIIFVVAIIYFILKMQNSENTDVDVVSAENSKAESCGVEFFTNLSHLQCHGVCVLYIDNSEFSTAIISSLTLYDIASYCEPLINRFRVLKKEKIDDSVQGKITMNQMEEMVKKAETETNARIISLLFENHLPTTYFFAHPIEFLKLAPNDKDMVAEYPTVICSAKERDQRRQVLRALSQKCSTIIPNASISMRTDSMSISF